MASITIRNFDDDVKTRLRVRAAEKGRSMEEEVRRILRDVVGDEPSARNLTSIINRGNRSLPPHGGRDTQRSGFGGRRHRGRGSLGGGMIVTLDATSIAAPVRHEPLLRAAHAARPARGGIQT